MWKFSMWESKCYSSKLQVNTAESDFGPEYKAGVETILVAWWPPASIFQLLTFSQVLIGKAAEDDPIEQINLKKNKLINKVGTYLKFQGS